MNTPNILTVARELAGRPEGMSNGELATAARLTSTAAGAYIQTYLRAKHIFKGQPEGKHARYFTTMQQADLYRFGNQKALTLQAASPDLIARAAVAHMRREQTRNSVELGGLCHVHPEVIDMALAPLVEAHKLVRASVRRGDVTMFDYRFSAAWSPQDADFDLCKGATAHAAPKATISPIAPPAPRAAPVVPPPAPQAPVAPAKASVAPTAAAPSPAPARHSAPTPIKDALEAGGELGLIKLPVVEMTPGTGTPAAPTMTPPTSLGWTVSREPALDSATLDAVLDKSSALTILEAGDLVCAINSRGELAIDLGENHLVKFPPAQALTLKRFLDNTSVLEELSGRNAI